MSFYGVTQRIDITSEPSRCGRVSTSMRVQPNTVEVAPPGKWGDSPPASGACPLSMQNSALAFREVCACRKWWFRL